MPPAALESAFLATIYRVEMPERCFDLQIGVADSALDDCLRTRGIGTWGILTACNPGAVPLSDDENRRRHLQLCKRLKRSGWHCFTACNLDAGGDWPPEPGCFIQQISQEQLRMLAGDFSQLAVVWGETGSPPCLLWV